MSNKSQAKGSGNLLTALFVILVVGGGGWAGYRMLAPEPELAEVSPAPSPAPSPTPYAAPSSAAFSAPTPEAIAQGGELFQNNCAPCHGAKGVGENQSALRGGDKPGGGYWAPALNGNAHTWHHSPDMIFRLVKEGSPTRDSPMRGWKGRMSDEEMRSVLAYVQSLWPERILARYRQAFPNG